MKNTLYFGDNLNVLRLHVPDESVDLVYLDPPFNSNANYNVLFAEKDGSRAASQIQAFTDTWEWNQASEATFADLVLRGGKVADCIQAFRTFLGACDLLAYLVMMAPRLVQLRRVMKPTASIYLHCDPTASHYLKMLMDAVFGAEHFLNEVIWKRTYAHGSAQRYGDIHDTILFYSKSDQFTWLNPKAEHDPSYLEKHFHLVDARTKKRFQPISLTGPGTTRGDSGKPWKGVDPTKVGRHWALPGKIISSLGISGCTIQQALDALETADRIYWPQKEGGTPRLKWFVDDTDGVALPDIWNDIGPISAQAAERMGYPTQKPVALLERIIEASSHRGDVVLDPFCGCGTTVDAAQKLERRWIGIDITFLAINLMKRRLRDVYGQSGVEFDVVGEPEDASGASELAASNPQQFQIWALDRAHARPEEMKRGADHGIDGQLTFEEPSTHSFHKVLFSVKSGANISVAMIRDLRGVVERERAAMGVFLTMTAPTRPMVREAAAAGFYESPTWRARYPRIQILTIEQLMEGKSVQMPAVAQSARTFRKASPKKKSDAHLELDLEAAR